MSRGDMTQAAPKVVIVGGGISGLAAAHALGKAGIPNILIESRPRLGGVIETKSINGCVIEGGPDSFLAAKPQASALAKELGLGSELISSNDEKRITYIRRDGKMVPMPDGIMMMVPTKIMPMVKTPLLGIGTKLRMGLEYFRQPNGGPKPDRSVADFIRDHYGDEAVDYLVEPLLAGVYGGDPGDLSAKSVLTRFVDLETKYGSLTRGTLAVMPKKDPSKPSMPLFQTLRSGLGILVDSLEKAIAPTTEVRQDTVAAIERTATGWRVQSSGGAIDATHVILAMPAHAAANLIKNQDAESADLLDAVGYTSSITIAIAYRKQDAASLLPGFGFLVPKKERKRLLACTFVHNKFVNRAPDDLVLLRCFLTGEGGTDAELESTTRAELKEMLGLTAEPVFCTISRWPRAMAQYSVGHADRMARLDQRMAQHPGLYLAGNALNGIGIPDCIQSGQTAAGKIVNSRVP